MFQVCRGKTLQAPPRRAETTTPLEIALAIALAAALVVVGLVAPTRPPQAGAPAVDALRVQAELLAQGQGTLHQALTTVQGTLSDLQARLMETGAGIKDHLARDLQEARRDL
jgi:hypothetical protein